jgi:hypothetical protein
MSLLASYASHSACKGKTIRCKIVSLKERECTSTLAQVSRKVRCVQDSIPSYVQGVNFHHGGHRGHRENNFKIRDLESYIFSLQSSMPSVSSVVNSPLPQIND